MDIVNVLIQIILKYYLDKKHQKHMIMWLDFIASNVVIFSKKNFLLENKIFGYPLPLHKSFDIDTDEDLELVKNLYSKYRNK